MEPVSKPVRIAELIILFVILPLVYLIEAFPIHKLIPLISLFAYCFIVLYRNGEIKVKHFPGSVDWKIIFIRFILFVLILFTAVAFSSKNLWADFSGNKKLIIMLALYPLLSALPQELIFRKFFFHRYAGLFSNRDFLLVINILLFSFAHIYFGNWIVIVFTLVGGLIFTLTFLKYKSLWVVTVEHSLYGLLILSSGLSPYFYKPL
jgi:uncharacterized protein